ncbi:MAG TPA: carboxypeptidase regulatory-like domain-containing protein [Candidatus Acidoferrales bacterium]|nr:carboxypeptidase regulatory-like domain-containing protein [Candidatus Acidoferrales bacterium]
MGRSICAGTAAPLAWTLAAIVLVSPATVAQQAAAPTAEPQQPPPMSMTASNGDTTEIANISAEGVVHTVDGSPIPGATLRLVNSDTQKAWITWTDLAGKFEFPAVPPGHYRATATQLGFEEATADAQLSSGSAKPIELTLRVATLAELSGAAGRPGGRRFGGGPPGAREGGPPQGAAQGGTAPGGRGGRGGQLPPGILNAVQQGMAAGGFAQSDLGEVGGGAGAGEEVSVAGGAGLQPGIGIGAGGGSSSDAFLLQGTVGQGLSFNAPGGMPGPAGLGGFEPGVGPGIPGVAGFAGPGGPGGNAVFLVQGGPGGPEGGPPSGGFGGPGGLFGGGGGGRGGRGGGGGGGGFRLFRQNVNRVRFSFYDNYQNSAFDAKPFSITGVPAPKVGHYDERAGANMGGPLKIPHIYNGSDHTYFFVNYQHETVTNPINTYSIVPTPDQRNGCFTAGSVLMPFTTTPYTTQGSCTMGEVQVPVNPIAQGLLKFFPQPTPNLQTTSGQNYLLQGTTPQNTDTLNTNVLHTINAKWNANAGYSFNSQRATTVTNFAEIGGNSSTRNQSVTLGLSHNWSPHVVESEQVVWSRNRVKILSDNSFTTNLTEGLGISGASTSPIDFGIPAISFTNFSGLSDPIPSLVRNQTLRASDNLSWTHGSHTMRFGGEIRRYQYNTDSNPVPRGNFIFTGLATGSDLADFLLGLPQTASVQFGDPNTYFRSWGFSAFTQDDWRVNKVFTFQYGLRYDAVTPPIELYNNVVNLDITDLAGVSQVGRVDGLPSDGLPRALIHGKYNNFEPRIGFAWQPKFLKPKTVVRGGYSIFYNESIYATLVRELAYQPPVDTAQTVVSTAAAPLTLATGLLPQTSTIPILNTQAVAPFYKPGYAQIWNLSTETSLSQNWILDLTYTGTKGTDLDVLRAPNRAPLGTSQANIQSQRIDPDATGFTFDQSGANSIYNALQVRVMHRFTRGFLLQGIYTWGKSLDDASSIGGGASTVEQQDGNLHAEYGLSTFDIRNQFRAVSMWELPFGQRRRLWNHGWKEHVFSDWRLQNIFTWQTGTPQTVLLGGVASDNGTGANFSLRPDITGNPNLGICGGTRQAYFNTGVFALPVDSNGNLSYGDEPRGAVEGPCTFNWNASIAKTIRFGPERRRTANFSWQISNLTNTPNFTGIGTVLPCGPSPNGVSGTGTAAGLACGSMLSGGQLRSFFGRVTSAGQMRTMSLMVRVNL